MPSLGSSDYQFVDVNEAWQKVTGFTREEVIGRTTSELHCWVNPGAREWLIRELRIKARCAISIFK